MKIAILLACLSLGASETKNSKQEKRVVPKEVPEAYQPGGWHHAAMAAHAARQHARQAGIWCTIL